MSSNLMGKGQTPFLDSLSRQSLYFENMYSAGNHTNHGMYATLYSWPAIMFRNLMKGTVIPHYSGLPTVLHDQGYKNYFFMTHESQYDNMNGFFRTNGFDEIYAQENYPSEKIVNSFGVQDDFLYSYAVEKLNKEKKPFFAVLLSVSNHPPFVIPDYFKPKSSEKDQQIVEYADWSIRKLFDEAKKERWFDNTIFVLLGDHGKLMDNPECELPESYNHIPLIIYGKGIKPQTYQDFALQEDVAPTLLGMMGIGYIQNDFGIDLMKKRRDCVFYTGDNLIAARDMERLYLYSPTEKTEHLYMVKGRNKVEKATAKDADFERLKNYVFSMIQTAEVLVGEKKTVTKK
jgi:phosphoglycerol transferase MdoB-like AlkP superfamily enzyme